jgi:hypothetical protein
MFTIEDFINAVIKDNISKMVKTDGLQYLSFGVMSSMIEFMGACFDDHDFFEPGKSEKRFKKAINELNSFREYRKHNDGDHDIYKNLRCGMAHIGKPGKGIAFTELKDSDDCDKHLKVCNCNDGTKRLILVCEYFFCDLNMAAKELLDRMKSNDQSVKKKHDQDFMNPNLRITGC